MKGYLSFDFFVNEWFLWKLSTPPKRFLTIWITKAFTRISFNNSMWPLAEFSDCSSFEASKKLFRAYDFALSDVQRDPKKRDKTRAVGFFFFK